MDWSLAAAFFCGLGDDEFFEFVLFDCSLGDGTMILCLDCKEGEGEATPQPRRCCTNEQSSAETRNKVWYKTAAD